MSMMRYSYRAFTGRKDKNNFSDAYKPQPKKSEWYYDIPKEMLLWYSKAS